MMRTKCYTRPSKPLKCSAKKKNLLNQYLFFFLRLGRLHVLCNYIAIRKQKPCWMLIMQRDLHSLTHTIATQLPTCLKGWTARIAVDGAAHNGCVMILQRAPLLSFSRWTLHRRLHYINVRCNSHSHENCWRRLATFVLSRFIDYTDTNTNNEVLKPRPHARLSSPSPSMFQGSATA